MNEKNRKRKRKKRSDTVVILQRQYTSHEIAKFMEEKSEPSLMYRFLEKLTAKSNPFKETENDDKP